MAAKLDLTAQRFGILIALEPAGKRGKETLWRCLCDCGQEAITQTNNLRSGNSKSCGCQIRLKHGHSLVNNRSIEYMTWAAMIQRCTNPNNNHWLRYGGRGIKVCDRWCDFRNFFADMGKKPSGLTLDRINNDGNYEPDNCQWASRSGQNLNRGGYRHSIETRVKLASALRMSYKNGRPVVARGASGRFISHD